jgi:transposase
MPALLDQIDAEVASMTADGAYDGETVYDAVAERHPEAAVIIPPRATAVPTESATTQRDRRFCHPWRQDRLAGQRAAGV